MRRWDLSSRGPMMTTALIAGICIAVAVLAWFGYAATREWRRSAELLEQRRADQAADLFMRALVRDMRGVESAVLRGLHAGQVSLQDPNDLNDMVAGAFARYPYPETFFGWTAPGDPDEVLFFTRADRRPGWVTDSPPARGFPVAQVREPSAARTLIDLVSQSAAHGQRFAVFETTLGGEPYQVVARLMYHTSRRAELQRVFGFAVNLAWVRTSYFSELTGILQRIAAAGPGLTTAILDESGAVVAGAVGGAVERTIATRRIRPLFFDPALVGVDPAEHLPLRYWTIVVSPVDDPTRAFRFRGMDRTIAATTAAVAVLGVGLLLTARALRASADLAKVRADFVASVTHELKTPLSTIRIVGETLSRGRLHSGAEVREYAQLLDQEAKRLARLVDNLLAYSRVTDVSEVYSFEPLDLTDFLDDVLRGFQPQFANRSIELHVEIPADLPSVRGDRTALALVFDNLIDNAVRYSCDGGRVTIAARQGGSHVTVDVADRGIGIPPDELETVVRRFVRGRQSGIQGSGLGLPIASRVVTDHGGALSIESTLDVGTTVHVTLPIYGGSA